MSQDASHRPKKQHNPTGLLVQTRYFPQSQLGSYNIHLHSNVTQTALALEVLCQQHPTPHLKALTLSKVAEGDDHGGGLVGAVPTEHSYPVLIGPDEVRGEQLACSRQEKLGAI